jgi:hypothetical protein
MPQGERRHAARATGPANRGPWRSRRLAAIAGALILAGLGAWILRRRRGLGAKSGRRAPANSWEPARSPAPAEPHPQPQTAVAAASEPAEAAPAAGGTAQRRRRGHRLARWLPALVGALLVLALGTWILIERGDVLVMQTPSMGTTAPAGSLVLTRPIGGAPLRVGMIVAFHVPVTGQVYMHRVAALLADGRFRTRGDLNSSDDGWELTRGAIVGVPALIVPDLGWFVMGLPWALAVLAAGAILSFLLPRFLRPALRSITVGGAVALPLYVVRPFVRVAVASAGQLATVAHAAAAHGSGSRTHRGGVTLAASSHSGAKFAARLVNGGVLPLRVTLSGSHTVIEPGHAGVIGAQLARHATSTLQAHPVLPIWAWLLLGAVVLAPLAAGLLSLGERGTTADHRGGGRQRLNSGRSAADKS